MNLSRADQISPLDIFKIGIGPSSSHTIGPMIAALEFKKEVLSLLLADSSPADNHDLGNLKVEVELYGSLSATGRGHITDGAICAGLMGMHPKTSSPEEIWSAMPLLKTKPYIGANGRHYHFHPDRDISWLGWFMDEQSLPHPNTMRFRLSKGSELLLQHITLSVGGGFVERVDSKTGKRHAKAEAAQGIALPYPYNSASDYVAQCVKSNLKPWQIVIANENARGVNEQTLRSHLAEVLGTFAMCIERGLHTEGILPGGLNVRRRAKALYEQMLAGNTPAWAGTDLRPSVYAIAVNEENAAGGRVVTAPTNGSSGLIPAVWRTLKESSNLSEEELENGLMVASVIGALVKIHASISGAEVGCQGEVGTSCAMAAGGAVAMLGGTPYQIEQAAEIGIEHHLGMTCDPIMGLVQVPCIERNAMGAVKALNAAALSLASDGKHLVSLDKALAVMKQTGLDMNQKYKETATGGLALG